MSQTIAKRQEIPLEQTWNLCDIFKTESIYQDYLKETQNLTQEFTLTYKSLITPSMSEDLVITAVKSYELLLQRLSLLEAYASLDITTDMTDATKMKRHLTFEQVSAELSATLSFFYSALLTLSDELILKAAERAPAYKTFFTDLILQKPHQLAPETEKVLAQLSPQLTLPNMGYQVTKLSDLTFPDIQIDNKNYPLSYVQYENHYCFSPQTSLRRAAFAVFSTGIKKYLHTTATYYYTQVQKEKTLATLRGYDSVFDYLLEPQKVDRTLYDRQIDLIMTELAPHMRRYAKLLAKAHHLDKLYYSDLKITMDPEFQPTLNIEQAKDYVEKSLAVLGPDYNAIIKKGLNERWIDWANNQGKSTGGFCAFVRDIHPYILLSWNSEMSELFTLVHELGHAAQSLLTDEKQNYLSSAMSMYSVEAPSTCNELLLGNYLFKSSEDPRFQRWVCATLIANTYYHNFVTHFLEAAYQREVYRLIDQGKALQAEDFNRIFKEQLELFWQDAVILDEGAELTWMRQPHYYDGLYSYTYSAGLTISTAVSQRILKEGQPAVQDWLNALSTGASTTPIEFAKIAGIDITSAKPLQDTIAYIGSLVDQIEAFVNLEQ